jgi:hypothetical protein
LSILDLQAFLLFFLFCLPVSAIYVWPAALVDGGFVRSVGEMPWEFRLAVRMTGVKKSEGFAPMAVAGPLLLLAIINLLPVLLAVVGLYGPISFVAAVAYVVAHLCWLARIRRAIRRADGE